MLELADRLVGRPGGNTTCTANFKLVDLAAAEAAPLDVTDTEWETAYKPWQRQRHTTRKDT